MEMIGSKLPTFKLSIQSVGGSLLPNKKRSLGLMALSVVKLPKTHQLPFFFIPETKFERP
jgi:hypothetical protein